MSDSTSPQLVPELPDTTQLLKSLPKVVNEDNFGKALQFMTSTGELYVRGAFRIGCFILKDKPNLTNLILDFDYSIHQLKSWKAFAKLCKDQELKEDQIFKHGFSLHAISKSLKPSKEKVDPKDSSTLDQIKDFKELLKAAKKIQSSEDEAQKSVVELKAKIQTKDTRITELEEELANLKANPVKSKPQKKALPKSSSKTENMNTLTLSSMADERS